MTNLPFTVDNFETLWDLLEREELYEYRTQNHKMGAAGYIFDMVKGYGEEGWRELEERYHDNYDLLAWDIIESYVETGYIEQDMEEHNYLFTAKDVYQKLYEYNLLDEESIEQLTKEGKLTI